MRVLLICLALYACAEESPQEKVRPGAAMDAEVLFTRGTALASEGRHTEAIDAYQQAAALAPKSAKIHYNLGNAYVRQLDYPSAMAAYQRVLALDSTHVSARHNLAAMYVKQLNYAQAIEEHRRVLSLDPGHLTTYYDLGYIYFLARRVRGGGNAAASGAGPRPGQCFLLPALGPDAPEGTRL